MNGSITNIKFDNPASAHTTYLHLIADGISYSEKALRAAGKAGKIPSIGCGNKRLYWYENVLRYIREGEVLEAEPESTGKIRPLRA